MTSKRKVLTLNERIKVLELGATKSARKIANELGVGKTQIQNILNRKQEVLSDFENNRGDRKRPRRITGNEELNDSVLAWYIDAVSRNVTVTGPLLVKQAREIASELGNTTFKGSNGWLQSFQKNHNIVFKTKAGGGSPISKSSGRTDVTKPDCGRGATKSRGVLGDWQCQFVTHSQDNSSEDRRLEDTITISPLYTNMSIENIESTPVNPGLLTTVKSEQLEAVYMDVDDDVNDDVDDEYNEDMCITSCSTSDAHEYIHKLKCYALGNQQYEMHDCLLTLEEIFVQHATQTMLKTEPNDSFKI